MLIIESSLLSVTYKMAASQTEVHSYQYPAFTTSRCPSALCSPSAVDFVVFFSHLLDVLPSFARQIAFTAFFYRMVRTN